MRTTRKLLFQGIVLLAAPVVQAGDIEPFYNRNTNPFVQVFGLPVSEAGTTTPDDVLHFRWQTDIANSATAGMSTNQVLIIDGESYHLNFSLRYGWAESIEVGMDLPYIVHENGVFDQLVQTWHDITGLPNGERDNLPKSNLQYVYTEGGVTVVNVDNPTSGFGDLRLSAAWALPFGGDNTSLALRGGVKLPTGDADDLTGSGGTDLSLGLGFTHRFADSKRNWTVYGSAGVLRIDDTDFATGRIRRTVQYGSIGWGFNITERWVLKAQLDVHTAAYDTNLDELGNFSGQLVFGGAWSVTDRVLLEFSATEDVFVDTSPDIVGQIGFRVRLGE